MTSWRYWCAPRGCGGEFEGAGEEGERGRRGKSAATGAKSLLGSSYRSGLLKIHCVVVSRSVKKGSSMTVRANQKSKPVIGETLILFRLASPGADCFTLSSS